MITSIEISCSATGAAVHVFFDDAQQAALYVQGMRALAKKLLDLEPDIARSDCAVTIRRAARSLDDAALFVSGMLHGLVRRPSSVDEAEFHQIVATARKRMQS